MLSHQRLVRRCCYTSATMAEPPAGMPEGLSKMEQMKWKRDQQKQAAAGGAPPPVRAAAAPYRTPFSHSNSIIT